MRNDLKEIATIKNVETDVNNKSVTVEYQSDANIVRILDAVAEKNDKLKDFVIIEN